jgi:hypothetical protein
MNYMEYSMSVPIMSVHLHGQDLSDLSIIIVANIAAVSFWHQF